MEFSKWLRGAIIGGAIAGAQAAPEQAHAQDMVASSEGRNVENQPEEHPDTSTGINPLTGTPRRSDDPFAGFEAGLAARRASAELEQQQREETLSNAVDHTPTTASINSCSIITEGDERFVELQNGQRVNLVDHFGHRIRPAQEENDEHQFYVEVDGQWLPVVSYVSAQDRENHIIAVPEEYHVVDRAGVLSLRRLDEPPEEVSFDFTQN